MGSSNPATNDERAEPRLIGDIGGTYARFAIAEDGSWRSERVESVAKHPSLAEAIEAYLSGLSSSTRPSAAVLAVAGYVKEDQAELTNVGWSFSLSALRTQLGLTSLKIVNDFEAVAIALPSLGPADVRPVGALEETPYGPKAVIGPGTGLGIAGLLPTPNGWVPMPGEGGHATMSAADKEESRIIDLVRDRFSGHASAERFLSGPGLVNLYQAICCTAGVEPAPFEAQDVTRHAVSRENTFCEKALDVFCSMLGVVAGNVALTFGAKGGVYIAGGILPKLSDYFVKSSFRKRFEQKGRLTSYVESIPTFLITHPYPGLVGLANHPSPMQGDHLAARAGDVGSSALGAGAQGDTFLSRIS